MKLDPAPFNPSLRLRRMSNPEDIDRLRTDAIHHDVIWMHYELTRRRDAPGACSVRQRSQTPHGGAHLTRKNGCRFWLVRRNKVFVG